MRKKVMIFASVLLMLTIISPASFAASTNTIDQVVPLLLPNSILNIGDSSDFSAPILQIEDSHGDFQYDQTMSFYLELSNAEWTFENTDNSTNILDVTSWTYHEELQNSDWDISIIQTTHTSIEIKATLINNDAHFTQLRIPMLTRILNEGEARVTINPRESRVSGGTYTFATVAERPYTVVTVEKIPTLEGEGPHTAGRVIVDETFPDVLVGANTLSLSLSEGFHWHENTRIRFYSLNITPLDGLEVAEDHYYKLTSVNGNNATISFDSEKHFTRGTIVIEPIITDTILSPSREVHLDIESLEGKAETHTDILIATTAANDDDIVDFPDINLEQAIREKLDKPTGDITRADMATITEIFLYGLGIEDLSGIEHATNLSTLLISSNNIEDISALSLLTNLTDLYLDDNPISDFSPLSSLVNLTSLALEDCNISDLSPVIPLTALRHLYLSSNYGNSIEDITPLANLTNLETLALNHNLISDISTLSHLYNLKNLSLNYNNISDLSPIQNLTELRHLSLSNNPLNDITPLAYMMNLETLYISNSGISNIEPLSGLIRLVTVGLSDNQIEDISPLVDNSKNNGIGERSEVNVRGNLLDLDKVETLADLQFLINKGVLLEYTTAPGMLPILPDAPGSSDLAFMRFVIDGDPHGYNYWWGVDRSTRLVPIQNLGYGLMISFELNPNIGSITLYDEETEIRMVIGSRTATVNNNPVDMDAEPIILFGRILVPAQIVVDQLGMTDRVTIELVQAHKIELSAEPATGGKLTGRGNFEHGFHTSVTATPYSGYRFDHWTENGTIVSSEASYTFPVTDSRTLTADFTPLSAPEEPTSPTPLPSGGGGGGGAPGTAKIQVVTSRDNTITRDEFTVIIPAQSLSMETFVNIRPLSDSQFLIPEGSQLASPIFDISLEDQDVTILKPITFKFNFDPELVPEGLMPSLFWYNAKSEEWHELEEIVVDWEKNTVTGQIDHLTPFAVLTVENPDYIAVEEIHEDIIQNQAVFIIGRTGYQIDGVWHEADAAPYIQPTPDGLGRTMMPVRYVSIALGADEVLWDAAQRLVTVKKGASVIQLTIGETILWRDNERIEMDVPAIVQTVSDAGGRTMIPVAHLAKALDVTYHWNAQDRSVTFELETSQEED